MNPNEIEEKIKKFKNDLREIDLQIARNEENQKNSERERQKIIDEVKRLNPSFDIGSLDEEISNLQKTIEKQLESFERELINATRQTKEG